MSETTSTSYKKTSVSGYASKQKTSDTQQVSPTATSVTSKTDDSKKPQSNTGNNRNSNLGGIPQDLPVRTMSDSKPGGIQPTGETASDKKDTPATAPNDSQGWLSFLKGNSSAPGSNKSPQSASDWLNYLKDSASNAFGNLFGAIKGQAGKFLGRLTNNAGDRRPTDMTAASGVTDKVGYADPRGLTCYSKAFLNAAKGAKSLHQVLSRLDGKNVCEGLNQRPQHVEPDKVGDKNYRNSNATLSKDNKDPNVKQFVGGFAGNDGGNINFDSAVKKVTNAIGNLANDPTKKVYSHAKANDYKKFFKEVEDYLTKNKDKKAVVTTYTATHGNVYNAGSKQKDGKEGGGNGSTLGIDEKTYDKFVRALKSKFGSRVVVNDIWDCCHAGAFMPARRENA